MTDLMRTELNLSYDFSEGDQGEFAKFEIQTLLWVNETFEDETAAVVGHACGVFCKDSADYLSKLDEDSQDLSDIAGALFDREGDLEEALDGGISNLWVLDRIVVDPGWRNQGIATDIITKLLQVASGAFTSVALLANPTEEMSETERKAASRRLISFYERFDFRQLEPNSKIMLCDASWKPGCCPIEKGKPWLKAMRRGRSKKKTVEFFRRIGVGTV